MTWNPELEATLTLQRLMITTDASCTPDGRSFGAAYLRPTIGAPLRCLGLFSGLKPSEAELMAGVMSLAIVLRYFPGHLESKPIWQCDNATVRARAIKILERSVDLPQEFLWKAFGACVARVPLSEIREPDFVLGGIT